MHKIGIRIPFPNNTGISQIICICMLLITTFECTQLAPYWMLYVVILSMSICPEIHLQLNRLLTLFVSVAILCLWECVGVRA